MAPIIIVSAIRDASSGLTIRDEARVRAQQEWDATSAATPVAESTALGRSAAAWSWAVAR